MALIIVKEREYLIRWKKPYSSYRPTTEYLAPADASHEWTPFKGLARKIYETERAMDYVLQQRAKVGPDFTVYALEI